MSENPIKIKPIGLSPRDAYDKLKEGIASIIDVRPEYETCYRSFDVPKVYLLPFTLNFELKVELPTDEYIIVADNVGLDSPDVARKSLESGYPLVGYIIGGVVAWDRAGLPLIKDLGNELTGGCACKLKPRKLTQKITNHPSVYWLSQPKGLGINLYS